MLKVLKHGFFSSTTRGYHAHPQEHLNALLSRLNYLPGFVEAKGKNLISSQEISSHSIEHIENTLMDVFSSTHYQNALVALEKKKFTIHELLSVDRATRVEYLNQLEKVKPCDIPDLASIKKDQEAKISFCPDNTLAKFTRTK